jgi:hypothetical protein
MNGEAKALRKLAERLEEVVRESEISSMAWPAVSMLCDYLTCRARNIELHALVLDAREPIDPCEEDTA